MEKQAKWQLQPGDTGPLLSQERQWREKQILEAVKIVSGRENYIMKSGKLEVSYCKHNTICQNLISHKRSVNVLCVQTKTALSGRHCILKQSWSFSSHYPGSCTQHWPNQVRIHEVCCQLLYRWLLAPSWLQFTHFREYMSLPLWL